MNRDLVTEVCEERIYNKVYEEYAEPIFHHFYYKFGNVEWAEEVVQESFIKLWKKCKDVPYAKAKSFLYTVSNNWLINKHHHQKVKLKYKNQYSKTNENNQSPEFLLEEKEFKKRLLSAIENLNPKQRSVFLLHRINGKSYKEIAQIENIGLKAVEKRMSLALQHLRKHIKEI
ncbi:RNA polymerase sigma factor [Psychroflexus salis]|uniref:DNA-directed RNA polymerase sigma-70 factor n=1 Tax=Psychroflexus salis TaxID=1526574 RepID=A0A916ZR37_9FLAO|nr:RNA polymerase sigma factor [Psychroflexus salis]GGE07367.1 DNA-directed RNA polymerase sigma-70 factor [Psychroflexus salis]